MARYQAVRGNPEDKLSIIIDDFSGGVNTTSSDDLTPQDESRYMSNYKLEQYGDLRNREGWRQNAVSELFTGAKFPVLVPTQKSVLYGSAHEKHAYYQPNLIPKPWDFSNFEFHGAGSKQVQFKPEMTAFDFVGETPELIPNGNNDLEAVVDAENLIKDGWDSFKPYGNEGEETKAPLEVFDENYAQNNVKNGDFRFKENGWQSRKEGKISFDKNAMVINYSGTMFNHIFQEIEVIEGNKYYLKTEYDLDSKITMATLGLKSNPTANYPKGDSIEFGKTPGNHEASIVISGVKEKNNVGIYTQTISTEGQARLMIKYIISVDLTKVFGKGNEPTKEWCDTNLKYYANWGDIAEKDKPVRAWDNMAVHMTPLGNGLTRIQTWGGNNSRKLRVTDLPRDRNKVMSFFVKDNSFFSLYDYYSSGTRQSYEPNHNGIAFNKIGLASPNNFIESRRVSNNLDFIASDPIINEGDTPNVTFLKEELDNGMVSIQTYGGASKAKFGVDLGKFPVDTKLTHKVYVENQGEEYSIGLGELPYITVEKGFKGYKEFKTTTTEEDVRLNFLTKVDGEIKTIVGEISSHEGHLPKMETRKAGTTSGVRYVTKYGLEETKIKHSLGTGVTEDTDQRVRVGIINHGDTCKFVVEGLGETEILAGYEGYIDVKGTVTEDKFTYRFVTENESMDITITDFAVYDSLFLPFKNRMTQGVHSEALGSKGTLVETTGGNTFVKLGYSLHKDIHPFTVSVWVDNIGEDNVTVRASTNPANQVVVKAGESQRVRVDSAKGSQPRLDFMTKNEEDSVKIIIKDPFIVEGHITDLEIEERQLRRFPTRVSKLKLGAQFMLDIETKDPSLFKITLDERITDEKGDVEIKEIGEFKHLVFKEGRFFSTINAMREVVAGTVMGDDRKSYTTDIVLSVKYLNDTSTTHIPFKINRLTQPVIAFDEKRFSDQILLMKVMKNEFNVLNRLMMFDTLEEYQRTLIDGAWYELEFLMVHRQITFSEGKTSVGYDVVIDVLNFKIGNKNIHKKVTNVGKLDTKLTPYLKDFGTQTLNISNIGSEVSKGSLIFTGTDHGIIEVYDDKGTYKMRYVGAKKSGVANNAYKPTPLEVRRVGFNVLGTAPLTWIDNTGTTSKSIQGIYVTDDANIPAAVLPMGKPFKIHIMYTGDKATFDVELSSGVGEEDKKKLDYDIKEISNDKGLYIARVNFKTQPQDEVEFKISFKEDDKTPPMYDYYHLGQIPTDAKPVETLDVGSYGITQVWDRYVYFKGDTLWYSDFSRFDYVPNLNYITLPLRPNDNIVKIIFFRTSYMIFTQERIYKISGMFDTAETRVELVSDTVGCVAPDSIAMVDNKLVFLSTIGLVALKAEVFRQNLENIEVIDDKVQNMIETTTAPYAVAMKNQYLLFLNNNYVPEYLDEVRTTTSVGGREVNNPNVVRYYVDNEAFAFDLYNQYQHPLFVFETGGNLFSYRWDRLYTYEDGDLDFDEPFDLELETPATNFGYPAHEKKFKQVILKLGKESYQQRFEVVVMVDGMVVHEEVLHPENIVAKADIANSRFHIRKIRLPSLKGKNIAMIIRTNSKVPTTIMSISYIYKLGKIRERRAYR